MKKFQTIDINYKYLEKEIGEYHDLLLRKKELSEQKDILPFFKDKKNLACSIGHIPVINIPLVNNYAFEYDIFSDFTSDLVIGDSVANQYCFIEFEDAKKTSIFKENKKKFMDEWSYRFEHGFSQIIDWLWKLDDMRQTNAFAQRFPNTDSFTYCGLLIIGRDDFIKKEYAQRINWRKDKIVVNSSKVFFVTYDKLFFDINNRIENLKLIAKSFKED